MDVLRSILIPPLSFTDYQHGIQIFSKLDSKVCIKNKKQFGFVLQFHHLDQNRYSPYCFVPFINYSP